jgi:Fe2+ or Zn2+ uptake regulation protein
VDDIRELFSRHGLRCTRQRRDLYEILADSKDHPTAEILFQRAQTSDAGLSLATVYNTLEAFCSHGLCRRMPAAEGGARFDANVDEHFHVRTTDGRILDVPDDLGGALRSAIPGGVVDEIERRLGVSIEDVRIEFSANPRD